MNRTNRIVCSLIVVLVASGALAQPLVPGMPQMQASQSSQPLPPSDVAPATTDQKSSGKILIGVAPPVAPLGQGDAGFDASEAIRNTVIQYLQGPLVDLMPLSSRIEIQLQAEAKQKGCDYIFQSTVKQKKSGGMFGKLSSASIVASSVIPIAGTAGNAGSVAAGVASNAATSAASLASGFKNKDEITFQFKVTSSDGTQLIANTTKQKAAQDGDDVLSPQIQQAASTALEAMSKRKQQ